MLFLQHLFALFSGNKFGHFTGMIETMILHAVTIKKFETQTQRSSPRSRKQSSIKSASTRNRRQNNTNSHKPNIFTQKKAIMIINNKRFVSTILLLATTAVSFATATANKKKPLAFSSVLARSLQGSGVSRMMWKLFCSWTIHHRRCTFYRIYIILY